MNKNVEQDVAFIRALAELLRESELSEIEVTREYGSDDELKVRLSRAAATVAPVAFHQPAPAAPHPAPSPASAAPQPEAPAARREGYEWDR